MNREGFLQALKIVKPGLGGKDIVGEQFFSFTFSSGRVFTYNTEISISHPVEGLKGIEGAVKAEELYQLLSKMKEEEIEAKIEGEELRLEAGRTKAGLALGKEVTPLLPEGEWKNFPDTLLPSLKFAMFSCSKEASIVSRPAFTCINVRRAGQVESSDNHRLTRCEVGRLPVKTFLIPASSVRELVKHKPTLIMRSMGWVHFKTDEETIISCRVLEGGGFPETVDEILDVEGETLSLPKAMGGMLDKASIFSKKDEVFEEKVDVSVWPGGMRVHGRGSSGWFKEEADFEYRGKPFTFTIIPSFLKEVLKRHQTCTLGENRIKFQGEGWEHVIGLHIAPSQVEADDDDIPF